MAVFARRLTRASIPFPGIWALRVVTEIFGASSTGLSWGGIRPLIVDPGNAYTRAVRRDCIGGPARSNVRTAIQPGGGFGGAHAEKPSSFPLPK